MIDFIAKLFVSVFDGVLETAIKKYLDSLGEDQRGIAEPVLDGFFAWFKAQRNKTN